MSLTLILSVSIGVLAINILAFSNFLGWFTPIFLSNKKPEKVVKNNKNTETICMKCQILFSEKSKKNITNLSSAEFAQSDIG